MAKTRTIQVVGSHPNSPVGNEWRGDFLIPAEPAETSRHAEICARNVFMGEYSYPRTELEGVRTIVDVGCNVGAFIVWARQVWWPGMIDSARAWDPNIDALRVAVHNVPLGDTLTHAAITTEAHPRFHLDENWGASSTYGVLQTEGVAVPGEHPFDLPPCDCLKIDAEGVDYAVLAHYQHLDRVKVCLFEWHHVEHRAPMFSICERAGLVLRKNDCGEASQGVACWVRP